MSSVAQTKDITSHMVAFIKTHGGLDLSEFYEEYAEAEATDIIAEYTKMLMAAVKDDDNKSKLAGLAKKLTPAKSSRKKKDPDAPKRGKSAYIFFGQENREKAKEAAVEEHGDDFKNPMVMSKLAEMWSELKESTKAKDKKAVEKFEKMAADDKERYAAEMEEYTPLTEEELSEKLSSKKKRKDPNAPKRGKSAYIFFGQEYREQAKEDLMEEHGDDFKNPMVMSRLGEMWSKLKESKKPKDKKEVAKFEKLAADDKERYTAEMEDYTPPSTDEDEPPKKAAKKPAKKGTPAKEVKKKEVKKEVKKEKEEEKPAAKTTGFKLWKEDPSVKKDLKKDFAKLKPHQRAAKELELWKELDPQEKAEWKEKADAANEAAEWEEEEVEEEEVEEEEEEEEGEVEGEDDADY